MSYAVDLIPKLEQETGVATGIRPGMGWTDIHYCNVMSFNYIGWKQCGSVLVARSKDRMRFFKRASVTAKSVIVVMYCIVIILSSCDVEHLV